LANEIAQNPHRFAGFAGLPMQDPDAATRELTRCITELGFKGAMCNCFTQRHVSDSAIYYDLPEFRPFWATVAKLDVPFYLHPRLTIPSRAKSYEGHRWLYSPIWDFGSETATQALRLIGSGLFDEFPNLQVVLGHLGERIPFDMWRIDNLMSKLPVKLPAKKRVSEYLRNNFHLTTSGQFHDTPFHCALAEMGPSRIMFSVDYPYEEMAPAAAWFDKTELSDADRSRIGRTNAIKLFKLDLD
jgi:2,3-dihydroxybenzoate decarboxylase